MLVPSVAFSLEVLPGGRLCCVVLREWVGCSSNVLPGFQAVMCLQLALGPREVGWEGK